MSDLKQLRHHLTRSQHRQLVIISGAISWQQSQLQNAFSTSETVFWVTAKTDPETLRASVPLEFKFCDYEAVESKRLNYYLGQEIDGAVINVEEGLSADTLGIVSGMIKAGGLLVLLTPDADKWPNLINPEDARFLSSPLTLNHSKKRFTEHLINSWTRSQALWLKEGAEQSATDADNLPESDINDIEQLLPTQDQQLAIEKIKSVAFGHRKRPLVITADRGRGKSATLGIAAVESLLEGKAFITITASRPDQIKTAFKHARETLQKAPQASAINLVTDKPTLLEFYVEGQLKTLQYAAPDQLISQPTAADVLMVDEAAHLPTPLLIELLKRHHRMVFSTTMHGYEGSGRGFELRFKSFLNEFTPDWKSLHLKTPIRWAENDPLEQSIFDALLLNAKLADIEQPINTVNSKALSYRLVDNQELLKDRACMEALFGLLVQAHYQTSPNDLQQILNAPNINIIIAELDTQTDKPLLAGAALFIEEGKVNPSKNRLHGHLVPQLLTKHYAQQDFLLLSTIRVMRIAVHPELQRKGIGMRLIQEVEKRAQNNRIDYISSSFGASNELLPFWFQQHYWPLHVGVKRDKASGSHNLVVAKPLSAMSRQALSLIQNRFQEQFPHLLFEALPSLPAAQILCIIQTFRFKTHNYGLDKVLASYASGERPYESISSKLWEWSLQSANRIKQASKADQEIWCDKVLKRNDWQTVAHHHHLSGRKGVEQALKGMIDEWCKNAKSGRNGVTKQIRPYIEKGTY